MKYITFDKVFKVLLLIILALYLKIQDQNADKWENGRYQMMDYRSEETVILDTKTGIVKVISTPSP